MRLPRAQIGALALVAGLMAAGAAVGQAARVMPEFGIWDVALGAPVGDLPSDRVATIYCGTDGGPPSIPLDSFAGFATCQPEADGLREVGFTYDDEQAYIARALETEYNILKIGTRVVGHPALVSVLVDDAGIVQGIRVVTDDHAAPQVRSRAFSVARQFKAQFDDYALDCQDLPAEEGEQPVGRSFVKEACTGLSPDGLRRLDMLATFLRKKGQEGLNRSTQQVNVGYFESRTRLELRLVR